MKRSLSSTLTENSNKSLKSEPLTKKSRHSETHSFSPEHKTKNKECENGQQSHETFASFNLKPELLNGILAHGFKTPAPIQRQGIPAIISGKDVIAQAQSGSGKTATFCIGILQRLQANGSTTSNASPHTEALILVPTRELALQIQQVLQSLGSYTNVRCTCCYGGKSDNMKQTLQLLQRGQHVVVGTPGRVLDLMRRGHIPSRHLASVVLDEADEMFAMGLKEQLEKIRGLLPPMVQWVMLSATLPEEALALAQEVMQDPVSILVKRKEINVSQIAQFYVQTGEDTWKFECLVDLLRAMPSTALAVVFCNTRLRVENLHKILRKEAQNKSTPKQHQQNSKKFPTSCMTHGEMEQKSRELVMKQFFSREKRVLVCTDLWARGMDVPLLDLVVNFDLPQTHEAYIHRVGRTGRFGKAGVAISLVTEEEFSRLKNIQKRFKIPMKPAPAVLNKLFESEKK